MTDFKNSDHFLRFQRGLPNDIKELKNTKTNTAREARLRNQLKISESKINSAAEQSSLHTRQSNLTHSGAIELEDNEDHKFITQEQIISKVFEKSLLWRLDK